MIIAYNLVGTLARFGSGRGIAEFTLNSGAVLGLTMGDVLVLAGLVALFLEMLKSARPRGGAIVDHIFSVGFSSSR